MSASYEIAAPTLAREFERIAAEGERRALTLRAFGGIAFYLRTRDSELFTRLGRDPVNDLDLVGLAEERNEYKRLFKELDYEVDWDLLVAGEGKRFSFAHVGEPAVAVDLFIDRLDMCHRIDLRDRLGLQQKTVPLADLLLQKLQIVDLNRKDMVDVVVLLAEHELDGEGPETIDTAYAARLLADDWGFYYTATRNLEKIRAFVDEAGPEQRKTVVERIVGFEDAVKAEPKTRRWRLRAKIGTRKKWYQDVDEGTGAF